MATMKLLLLSVGLILLSVAAADEGALAIPGAAYRAVTFPASTEKETHRMCFVQTVPGCFTNTTWFI
ncbi:hypothetical protein LEMLEM_LOCUS9283 [Lemmus lemmus]